MPIDAVTPQVVWLLFDDSREICNETAQAGQVVHVGTRSRKGVSQIDNSDVGNLAEAAVVEMCRRLVGASIQPRSTTRRTDGRTVVQEQQRAGDETVRSLAEKPRLYGPQTTEEEADETTIVTEVNCQSCYKRQI